MHMLENEVNYHSILKSGAHKPSRDRNPFCLSLKQVCYDETAAEKFAIRQTNGIRPVLAEKDEPEGRKCRLTLELMRETTSMLESEIPQLAKSLLGTQTRLAKLERRQQRRKSAGASRCSTLRSLPSQEMYYAGRGRAQSATSQRSSSVLSEATSVLGRAQESLRPQTAKTTKTALSHRLHVGGWSGTLRQGDIKRLAGNNIPTPTLPWQCSDVASGVVRHRSGRPRTAAARLSQNSCRRAPGYRAPDLDIIEGGKDPYCGYPTGSPVTQAS